MMKRAFPALIACVVLCLSASGADKKKPPDVQILDVKATRDGDMVDIDGRLRITSEKPVTGLMLAFDFRSSGGDALVTKQFQLEEPRLVPGDEAGFRVQAPVPGKAVSFRIAAYKDAESELRIGNPGPYRIVE